MRGFLRLRTYPLTLVTNPVARGTQVRFVSTTVANSGVPASQSSDNMHEQELEMGTSNDFRIPFARAKLGPFTQEMPTLGNQYTEDTTLRKYLARVLPEQVYADIHPDLENFGHRVANDIYQLGIECERNPPKLEPFNAWGKRVDNIVTCQAWKDQKKLSAEEGLISIGYKRQHGQWSRIHQVVKLYLYSPSSGLYSCPLAMTDGASKILEKLNIPGLSERAFSHLTSRDPDYFWTSGQWMTEKRGGSDVANGTETVAVAQSDGSYKLYGYKWFSSATDSDMTLTLARVVDASGNVTQGTKGLSMFYLETRDNEGNLNNIEVIRLKDKLGTRQLPTAELLLDGVKAFRVSDEGRGIPAIAEMLTISRIHNSVSSVAAMRRIINLARDYSHKRVAFGKTVKDHPSHIKTLANMEVESRGGLLMVLEMSRLLGLDDVNMATQHHQDLLRVLTPVAKLYTAKQAMSVVSEGLECFGGAGYLEDTHIPYIFRDAQVLPIWEGTTNILSHDVLRAVAKTQGKVLVALHKEVQNKISNASTQPQLAECSEKLNKALKDIASFATKHMDQLEVASRDFAYSLGRVYIGALLTDHASHPDASEQDILAAKRWCEKDLTPISSGLSAGSYSQNVVDTEYQLVMDGYPTSKL